jgi:hypothetical protein
MQELAAYQGLAYLNTANGRLAWSKRLQRAHKFCLLVIYLVSPSWACLLRYRYRDLMQSKTGTPGVHPVCKPQQLRPRMYIPYASKGFYHAALVLVDAT